MCGVRVGGETVVVVPGAEGGMGFCGDQEFVKAVIGRVLGWGGRIIEGRGWALVRLGLGGCLGL